MKRRHSPARVSFVTTCLLVCLANCLFPLNTLAQQTPNAKRVLVLYWYGKDHIWNVGFERSFQSAIQASATSVEYYSEYLENNRFPGERQALLFRDYLKEKYADRPFDVVVASSDASLDFLLKYRKDLFPNSPIVFAAARAPSTAQLADGAGVTGVLIINAYKENLDLVLKLHPATKQVFVISGTLEGDKRFETLARQELPGYENKVQLVYLTDLSLKELIAKTKSLPEDSVILHIFQQFRDEQGKRLENSDMLGAIAGSANVPVYSMNCQKMFLELADSTNRIGVVGGYVNTSNITGPKVADMVLKIANGTRAQEVPLENAPLQPFFDWRELQRWGIKDDSLPPGSRIDFRQVTFWSHYKWRIIGVLSLLLLQSLFITYLLISRERRRRAEEERERFAVLAHQEHQHLDQVISNIPGIVWETRFESDGKFSELFLSQQVESLLGYSLEEWQSDPRFWLTMIPEEDRDETLRKVNTIFQSQRSGVVEFHCRAKDGRLLWIEANLSVIYGEDNSAIGLRGVSLDITSRKKAETELHTALKEVGELKEQLQRENLYLQDEIKREHNFEEIIGNSDEIRYVLYKVEKVAPVDSAVLIQGETGTGKELIARAIHALSNRKDRPMVKINCAALPASLIESELFGHEKGAFTGAQAKKIGRFEVADGATLFLDEIGELPLELQPKLLRVLQEGEFERLGSTTTRKADVRIIAATNRDLQVEVQNGVFREDLWYRLNVYPITVPPLRERKDDIPLLANSFIKQFSKKLGRVITSVDPQAIAALQSYRWPGNIRELRNTIERSVINAHGPVLQLADNLDVPENGLTAGSTAGSGKSLEHLEREIILRRLEETNWKISGSNGAAESLGLHPNTLRARIAKLDIRKESSSASAARNSR